MTHQTSLGTRLLIGSASAVLLAAAGAVAAEAPAAAPPPLRSATFSMYCYWTGEATLGRVSGVVASRIGHWGGSEIVEVDYDPERTDLQEMVAALKRMDSFYAVLVEEEPANRQATAGVDPEDVARRAGRPRFIEPKHSLRTRHPELLSLGLSEGQAIALNSWSYFGGPMPDVLTSEQKQRLGKP